MAAPKSFADLVGFKPTAANPTVEETYGTTVLSIKYDGGILTFADRRATMGSLIMYDSAEKVFPLDDSTVVAISGSFARSVEICRLLKHSLKYFRRMQLQEMSLDGKLQEITRALANNLPMVMNGIGVFIPIIAIRDPREGTFHVFSFDTAGARFELGDYAAAGSGSERIRGIFEYAVQGAGPWAKRPKFDVLVEGLRMLSIAADLDSATGGIIKHAPIVRDLTAEGTEMLDEKTLDKALKKVFTLEGTT